MTSIRTQLRQHIAILAKVPEETITDETPILQEGYLDSAGLLELIFVLEDLTNSEFDLDEIQPEHFYSIDSICDRFEDHGSTESG